MVIQNQASAPTHNAPAVPVPGLGGLPYLSASTLKRGMLFSELTTMGVGGPIDYYFEVNGIEDLQRILQFGADKGLPWMMLGRGANLLPGDEGFRGIVIRLGRRFKWFEIHGEILSVGGAMFLGRTVRIAAEAGLSGFEFAGGVPGTVAGGLACNAGTHLGSIGDIAVEIHCLDRQGRELRISREEAGFVYRDSRLREFIILGARFQLRTDLAARIRERVNGILEHRKNTQPYQEKCSGCMFKNPPGNSAGRLIDQLGMKGMTVGDAMISPIHANFVVNNGRATSRDCSVLMSRMARTVFEQYGVRLEPEVIRLNERGRETSALHEA